MAFFDRLKDSVLGYLTPGRTSSNQHRYPLTPATTPNKTLSRNANGKRPRSQSSSNAPNKRFKTPSGTAAYLTPPSSRITSSDEELDGDDFVLTSKGFEADEWRMINEVDEDSPLWETTSTKRLLAHYNSPEHKKRVARDTSSVQPDKQFDEVDLKRFRIQEARAKRQEDARDMREAGWAKDPIQVYLKLAMRGWEALFPKTWRLSFDSFPKLLFANKPKDEYIKAFSENQFRAMKAFRSLVMIASKARDATLKEVDTPPSRQPQALIRREINNYIKWAVEDAEVPDFPPTLVVVSGPEDVEPEVIESKMIKRLTKLKQEWIDALATSKGPLCDPPTMYGIIVSGLMLSFVALEDEDNGHEKPRIRPFSWNFLSKPEYDVWNTISIAILVIHCRTKMAHLKEIVDDYVGDQTPSDIL